MNIEISCSQWDLNQQPLGYWHRPSSFRISHLDDFSLCPFWPVITFFESNTILTSISNPHCLCHHLTGLWSIILKLSHLCYRMVSSFLSERNHCLSAPPSTFTSSHRNDDNYSNEDRCGAKAYLKVGGGWRLWNCVKNFWWQHRKEIFLMWF